MIIGIIPWRRVFAAQQQRLRRILHPSRMGTLRRTQPLSDVWGFDRGTPVDRRYIEQFLHTYRGVITGRVLEVQDSRYTERFGTAVLQRDVLDIDPANARATWIADLAAADTIPSSLFDCIILTQTLHLIYDTQAALAHVYRMLQPGGTALVTLPAVSRVSRGVGVDGDYWRFTVASARRLFGTVFGAQHVDVRSYGNVLTAMAFLTGMAAEELRTHEIQAHDPFFPVIVGIKATKPLDYVQE